MFKKENGFTLIELLIVIAVIGILAAIAVPAYLSRIEQTSAATCTANLTMIESAQDQWLADDRTHDITKCTSGDLTPTYIKRFPVCPIGGAAKPYVVTKNPPTCPSDDATKAANLRHIIK